MENIKHKLFILFLTITAGYQFDNATVNIADDVGPGNIGSENATDIYEDNNSELLDTMYRLEHILSGIMGHMKGDGPETDQPTDSDISNVTCPVESSDVILEPSYVSDTVMTSRCHALGSVYLSESQKCPERFCQHMSYECTQRCTEERMDCDLADCWGAYVCQDWRGSTVPDTDVCDGVAQCPDSDDELQCGQPCPPNCMCTGLKIQCPSAGDEFQIQSFLSFGNSDHNTSNIPTLDSSQLTYLVVESCSLNKLLISQSGSLLIFQSLIYLNLAYNDISTLSANVFCGLPTLEYLYLNDNGISSLSSHAFNGLSGLRELKLQNNDITTLPNYAFAGLSGLMELNLRSNRISTISSDSFIGLSDVAFLELYNNKISRLHENTFRGLSGLEKLELSNNMIVTLHPNAFRGLRSISNIYLSNNQIAVIPTNTFCELHRLVAVDLGNNNISILTSNTFCRLPSLVRVSLESNRMETISSDAFSGLPLLMHIYLQNNKISTLHPNTFSELPTVLRIHLDNNYISTLPDNIFRSLSSLTYLDLYNNSISSLHANTFLGLSSLAYLALHNNQISGLHTNNFSGLVSLIRLSLYNNEISTLPANAFHGLSSLRVLDLYNNNISIFHADTFSGLPKLKQLSLYNNRINTIPANAFKDLSSLKFLYLDNNKITAITQNALFGLINLESLKLNNNKLVMIHANAFRTLSNLQNLRLSDNELTRFPSGLFKGLGRLNKLSIMYNEIEVDEHMFDGLNTLKYLYTSLDLICCVKPKSVDKCIATTDMNCVLFDWCTPTNDAISSCLKLIRSNVLIGCLWVIGMLAFLGNTFVIGYRFIIDKDNITKSYSIFVLNLSISDLFMGIYLLIIGSVDIFYNGKYAWNVKNWRGSTLCTIAGMLSTISSEMSTFLVLLVSIDRFIVIVFPFSRRRITWRQALYVSIVLWVISVIIAIIPHFFLQSYFKGQFYSQSGVCLALPLTSDHPPGTYYSFSIFIVLNSVIFLLILVTQLYIFKSLRASSRIAASQTRRRDMAVARTLFFVVATDFCCWVPIGVMGVMARCGVDIPPDMYSWVMIFILPINAAVNPFLYTITYIWRKKRNVQSSIPVTSADRHKRPPISVTKETSASRAD